MRPGDLILRGYTEKDGDSYFAICLDLNIYARADDPDDATQRCLEFVCEYINEAVSDDQEFAVDLLSRHAPFSFWAKYRLLQLRYYLFHAWRKEDNSKAHGGLFTTPFPVRLTC